MRSAVCVPWGGGGKVLGPSASPDCRVVDRSRAGVDRKNRIMAHITTSKEPVKMSIEYDSSMMRREGQFRCANRLMSPPNHPVGPPAL